MKKPTIAIIGAGNMGSCIAGGLIKSGHPSDQLWISNPSKAKLEKLQKTFSLHISTDNTEILQFADVIIFALKPQVFKEATMALAHALPSPKPLIISIAAGIRENSIAAWLGDETLSIVRAMPNLPALIGCGATALHANNNVSATEHHLAETILGTIGMITWLNNESLMDTVTALSGSGPAYFFLIMEAMQAAAEELGLESATARLLTLQTALGAACMARETNQSLVTLREQVTSPGGTTEKALAVLEKNNIRATIKKALEAAKHRAEELAKLHEES